MARTYLLASPGQIRGDQLVAEIAAEHDIDVSTCYTYLPPDQVEVVGHDTVDLSATVAAHEPQSGWGVTDAQRQALAARERAKELSAKAQVAGLTTAEVDELAAQMQYIL